MYIGPRNTDDQRVVQSKWLRTFLTINCDRFTRHNVHQGKLFTKCFFSNNFKKPIKGLF